MSGKPDDFQRRKWQAQDPNIQTSPGSDITYPDDEESELIETRAWQAISSGKDYRAPLMWLVVAYPLQYRGTILTVQPSHIIGRKGEIYWRDPRMSRQHAQFTLITDPQQDDLQRYIITPLQDRNGTFVNGQRIASPTILYENDRIQMGDTLFVVKTLE